jgi:integrase/recombinase XerD
MAELKVAVKDVKLYRRHKPECKFKSKPNASTREADCGCSVWFQAWMPETNDHRRWSAKTTDWSEAVNARDRIKKAIEVGEQPWTKNYGVIAVPTGNAPASAALTPKVPGRTTVAEAIALFKADKETKEVTDDTKERYALTLDRLQSFCDRKHIVSIADLTSLHLSAWRTDWTVKSFHAKRSFETRAKHFLRYCRQHKLVTEDFTTKTGPLHTPKPKGRKDDEAIRPLSPAEYAKVLAAIDTTDMIPENKVKVALCMRLQRESGLSLIDACLLSKEELKKDGQFYTIKTERQKTGSEVTVPISLALGQELLKLKNGNPKYIFWSGNTPPASASDGFQKHYRRVAKAAGIDFSSHDLRHTFAIESLKAGVTLRQLSKALGHSSVKITEAFYAKWSLEEKDELQGALRESLCVQTATA